MTETPAAHSVDVFAAIEDVRSTYIDYPQAARLYRAIEAFHRAGHTGREGMCLMLVGPRRSGKTTILQRYIAHHPRVTDGNADRRPVTYVEVPAKCRLPSVAEAVLRALGDLRPSKGTLPERTARILHHMEMQQVGMLIFDEFQHLIAPNSEKVDYDVADWVKSLVNTSKLPILLAGKPAATRVLKANDQLCDRNQGVLRVAPFDWDDKVSKLEFRRILAEFEPKLRFSCEQSPFSPDISHRIYCATEGLIGKVVRLFTTALLLAEEDGLQVISLGLLSLAFERLTVESEDDDDEPSVNPFVDSDPEKALKPAPDRSRVTRLRSQKGKRRAAA